MGTYGWFHRRSLALFMMADGVSVLGDQAGWMGLLWSAMTMTKSAQTMGWLGLAFGLPAVALGPAVGHVLDHISHKRALVGSHLILGGLFASIAVLPWVHALPVWALLMFAIAAGCLTPFSTIGWSVVIPILVADDELASVNALMEMLWNGATILGPALGGFAIARAGSSVALLADATSFWLAALCVGLAEIPGQARNVPMTMCQAARSFVQNTLEAMKTLYTLRPLWWITVGAWALNLAYGALDVELPILAHRQFGRDAWMLGSLWTTYAISSLAGAAWSSWISKRRRTGVVMAMMVIGWGAAFAPLFWIHAFSMLYVVLACAGVLFGGYPPLARTVVQRSVPVQVMARIMGLRGALIALGPPLGSWLGGLLGRWLSPSHAIALVGMAIAVFGCWLGLRGDFRKIEA
ncbi:MFS transporter [Alicyclobacillus sendaiensis]|uniref:MFS transporter n=1 Tax=Alicyclobacillus sendaiensis TaxID=192387 RepID=UPI0026F444B5|nr:MFS transporter [Alicyclobacillus sendaiensis]